MRIYQFYNVGEDGERDAYDVDWRAQTFTPEIAHLISKVKLKLFRVGDPKTITVSIKKTTGGEPTGGDLCKGTIEGTDITTNTNGEWYEIPLGDGFELDKATQYAIVVRAPNGDASNKLYIRADVAEAPYPGGKDCGSSNSGIDWLTYTGTDWMFEEWGTGPPSPTTVCWGNLLKSQISIEKIEEAIARMIQAHEDDPNAHLEEGESLYSHKAAEIIDHLIESIISDKIKDGEVWERHRHAISAWKRLLAERTYLAIGILKKVWTGKEGEDYAQEFTFDGTYIYLSLWTSPVKVIKIDPETMATISTWTGATGENNGAGLIFDGTYLYLALIASPAKVIKIDPETMTTVDSWEAEAGHDNAGPLVLDENYLYVGLFDTPAEVVKINPATMKTVSIWTGEEGENEANGLTFDGIYIYVGLALDPAKVIKINPATMKTVSIWTGEEGEANSFYLTFDGTYVHISLQIVPAKVIKIDPATMETVATWTAPALHGLCRGLTFDGTYIYAALHMSPCEIYKIDPATMATISVWTGAAGENNSNTLTFDGQYIFIGLNTTPAKVIRKIMRDIDETGT